MTILIVDEDAIFRRSLQRHLPGETRCAASVADGVDVAAAWQPSVILLGVDFDSDGALARIPDFEAAVPRGEVIVMTENYRQVDADLAIDLGAMAYIEKGNIKELCELVQDARALVPSFFVAPARRAIH